MNNHRPMKNKIKKVREAKQSAHERRRKLMKKKRIVETTTHLPIEIEPGMWITEKTKIVEELMNEAIEGDDPGPALEKLFNIKMREGHERKESMMPMGLIILRPRELSVEVNKHPRVIKNREREWDGK
jgi:hypothetical protein